jgi:hypothetical protein
LNGFSEWYSNKRNTLLEHRNIHNSETWKDWLGEEGFTSVDNRYFMSKETVQLWDLMALATYLLMRALQKFPRLLKPFLGNTRKMRIRIFGLILRKFYLVSTTTGGDLVILATKSPPLETDAAIPKAKLARHE